MGQKADMQGALDALGRVLHSANEKTIQKEKEALLFQRDTAQEEAKCAK